MSSLDPRVIQHSSSIWSYRHDWERVEPDIGMVLTSEGWIAIDGGNSPRHGRRVFESMQAISPRPVIKVIDTHRHFDHTFGNQSYGAPVMASQRCQERFQANIEDDWGPDRVMEWLRRDMFSRIPKLSDDDFLNLKLVAPSESFLDKMSLVVGETELELFMLDGVHTDDSIGVCLPQEKVLFLGDAFYLLEGSEGCFTRLPELLDRVAKLDVETFIGSHERVHDRQVFDRLHEYCGDLIHRVRGMLADGVDEQEILGIPFDEKFRRTSFLSERQHQRFLNAAIRELPQK